MSWLLIIAMAMITFSNRYVFLSQWIRYQPSERLQRFLSYSSYAILTAIWAPIMFSFDSTSELSMNSFSHAGWDYVIAGSSAIFLSVFRVPSLLVVLVSTALFFFLRFFVL